MKITYNKNPLLTTVELDEADKALLWHKIKIAELEERLSSVAFSLQEGKHFDLEDAKKMSDTDYYWADSDDEKSQIDKRCDQLLAHFIEELQSTHVGDCTCVACSCSKCHAESYLGINTMPGLGKHEANKIDGAFGADNERTIEEAIERLSKFTINPENYQSEGWIKMGGYEQFVPRWKAEQERAHTWLVNYKNTHFNTNQE